MKGLRTAAIRRGAITCLLSSAVVLAGCNLPTAADEGAGPAGASGGQDTLAGSGELAFISVLSSLDTIRGPECMPLAPTMRAYLQPGADPIDSVSLSYRLVREFDGQTSTPFEVGLNAGEGDESLQVFAGPLADVGAQAKAAFDGGPGSIEYQLTAIDAGGASARWPADGSYESLPFAPCQPQSGLTIIGGDGPEPVAAYGEAPGCVPSTLTFTLTLANTDSLGEAWVNTRWYGGQPQDGGEPASDLIKLPLELAGDAEGNPGAFDFTAEFAVQESAAQYLSNQDGYLSWQLQARDQEGMVSIWPESVPDPVLVIACEAGEDGPAQTPVPTELGLAPLPTPTQPLGLAPPPDIQASGNSVTLFHEQAFDFDNGFAVSANSPAADFVLITDDDPYVDSLNPVNGAFVGWGGFDPPSSADDCNILKASMPMGLSWPDMDESFFCFDTSEGRTAWLKMTVYVSQPFNERRLEFDFTTYK